MWWFEASPPQGGSEGPTFISCTAPCLEVLLPTNRTPFHVRGTRRVSNYLADGDASTWAFAEFSSKWRMGFSHLRGGSYNRTVVHKLLPEYESPVRDSRCRVSAWNPVRTAARRRRRLVTARSTANHVVCEDIPPVFLKTLYYPSTIVDIHEESGTYLTPASAIEGRTRLDDQDEGLVAAPSTHRDQDSATSARRQEIALPWT